MDKEELKRLDVKAVPGFSFMGVRGWARVCCVYDGDSLTVIMKHAGEHHKFSMRLSGLDAYELRSADARLREAALQARNRVIQYVCGLHECLHECPSTNLRTRRDVRMYLERNPAIVWIECMGFDKYGRVLCKVYRSPDERESLNAILMRERWAYAYKGGKRWTEEEQVAHLTRKM